jgi:hypothetical protein
MNERIKELAEQAGIPVIEGHWDYNDREILVKNDGEWRKALPSEIIHTMFQSEKGLEKFAELLIKECVQTIQKCSYNSGDEWEWGLEIAENAIKERFGIES